MPLSLTDVRRIASRVAIEHDPALDVIGAAAAAGEQSTYAEVFLTIRGCREEPCRLLIGVSRDATERECQSAVKAGLDEHFREHPPAVRSRP